MDESPNSCRVSLVLALNQLVKLHEEPILKFAFPGHAMTGTKAFLPVLHLLGHAYFLASA